MSADSDTALPQQVAYFPVAKPGMITAAVEPTGDAASPATPATTAEVAAQPPATQQPTTDRQAAVRQKSPAPKPATETADDDASQAPKADQDAATAAVPVRMPDDAAANDKNQVIVTAMDPAATAPTEPKKRGFLSPFRQFAGFCHAGEEAGGLRATCFGRAGETGRAEKGQAAGPVGFGHRTKTTKPLAVRASLNGGGNLDPLPGVRQTALFEIKRKSGIDDDSDVDLHEDEMGGPIQLASAAGLARLAPNGLLRQTERVDVACLKPSLVRVLKTVERHYGRKIVVTSGYRSPAHNRRARGAKNSLHMYCAAADVQVEGVSRWELARFVRSMPGRGGVGTYCHTEFSAYRRRPGARLELALPSQESVAAAT